MFTEIQTVMVMGNWLDSLDTLIESVTIYCVEEGPCSDIMWYIYHYNNKNRFSLKLADIFPLNWNEESQNITF